MLDVPVLLIIFNRPDTTARVFSSIREAQPARLYIASDGPRENREGELLRVNAARDVVAAIDWPCKIDHLYQKVNLGCGRAVKAAVDWFFEKEEMGIILEDDCLPDQSFYQFCQELLNKYKNDTRIGMITGNNWGFDSAQPGKSYTFSKHFNIWGWASWRRSWQYHDLSMSYVNTETEASIMNNISCNAVYKERFKKEIDEFLAKRIDTWDYQWSVVAYAYNMLSIRPSKNLVANIGFGEDSTHTMKGFRKEFLKTEKMEFPIIHPEIVCPDFLSDRCAEKFRYSDEPKKKSSLKKLKKLVRKLLLKEKILTVMMQNK